MDDDDELDRKDDLDNKGNSIGRTDKKDDKNPAAKDGKAA